MSSTRPGKFVLGLDIGTNSVGWTLVALEGGKPSRLEAAGVRVFEAGLANLKKDGRGEGRAAHRRTARSRRRNLDRRARRLSLLFGRLQGAGLLPRPTGGSSAYDRPRQRPKKSVRERREERERMAKERRGVLVPLDRELSRKWRKKLGLPRSEVSPKLPFYLRAAALDEKLEPFEIGRALYHLGHRRGFKSNSKAEPDEAGGKKAKDARKKLSDMKQDMKALGNILESRGLTLGQYFSTCDPLKEKEHIRGRHTSREMYEREFNAIWAAQAEHYPDILASELKKRVWWPIFHQRPLKSARKFVGFCEYEKGKRRARWALLDAQRFRYLQKINDLRVKEPGKAKRRLTDDERRRLIETFENPALLSKKGNLTFAKARKAMGIPRGCTLSHEAGGETEIPGNRTARRLADIFGEKWTDPLSDRTITATVERRCGQNRDFSREWAGFLNEAKIRRVQDLIVEDWLGTRETKTLEKHGRKFWGLNEDEARGFATVKLEDGHCSLSRKALRQLVPRLERGEDYAAAAKRGTPQMTLPPVTESVPELRNPIVARSLTEMRKVVNGIIRKYGKPDLIRVELWRQLKRNAKQREAMWKRSRSNQKERDAVDDGTITDPQGDALPADLRGKSWANERVRLAKECRWVCPYTKEHMSMSGLFGEPPQFEVDHIVPRSRCLDDSFVNKTLCHHSANAAKSNNTPREAVGNQEDWEAIVERARKCFGKDSEKFRRFQFDDDDLKEFLDGFLARQRSDTAYAAKLARKYLGKLYGGHDGCGLDGRRRVQARSGPVTRLLREVWKLNGILRDGPGKSRDDHRHHAVDAVCIAVAEEKWVQMLNRAAASARPNRRFDKDKIEEPWPGFMKEVREKILGINVSHRVSRKVNGPLHKEILRPKGSRGSLIRIREGHPRHERLAVSGSNRHLEVVGILDNMGGIVEYEACVVPTFEAMRRLRVGEPVVRRNHGEGRKFLFYLMKKDTVELDEPDGTRAFYVVKNLSEGDIWFQPVNDARPDKEVVVSPLSFSRWAAMKASNEPVSGKHRPALRIRSWDQLRQIGLGKVVVTPLGEVRRAND